MKELYTAKATCKGGRKGCVKTDDGVLSLAMCMAGEHSDCKSEKCTNPEQLFACAYSACFLSAVNLILQKERLPYNDTKVDIYVHLNENEKHHFLSVDMDVYIPGVEKTKAEKVLQLANEICPYSKAIHNNVMVKLKLVE